MMRWQAGGASVDRGGDEVMTQAQRFNRNRKQLEVSYRTASYTEAGLSEVPLIRCGGDA